MFSDADRLIYQCPVTRRFYDPLAVKPALLSAAKGQYNRAVAEYPSEAAKAILLPAGRSAFGLPDDLNDDTVVEVITAFSKWLTKTKKQGRQLADFVSVFGFPPSSGPITYATFVSLFLCLRRGQLRKAQAAVEAARIAAGGLGEPEYYGLDSVDPTEANRAYQEARCRTALTRLTKRGRTA